MSCSKNDLYFHDKLVNVFLDCLSLDRDLRRFLYYVGAAEPRDFRLGIRLTLALHSDQRAVLVRDDARFLDEGRSKARALLCILERSTIRYRRRYEHHFRILRHRKRDLRHDRRSSMTRDRAIPDDVSRVVGSLMRVTKRTYRDFHDWLATARQSLPDRTDSSQSIRSFHREK